MDELSELLLYPQHTVLFPYAQTQLHVTGESALALVRRCLETESTFGTAWQRTNVDRGGESEPCLVGTELRVLEVHSDSEAGIELKVFGQGRFRIRKLDDTGRLLKVRVEPVEDEAPTNPARLDAVVSRTRELAVEFVHSYMRANGLLVTSVRLPDDVAPMSFAVASILPLSDQVKQHALELTDTAERLALLIPALQQQLDQIGTPKGIMRLDPYEMRRWIQPN